MAEIKVIENAAAGLAEFRVIGEVSAEEIIAVAREHAAFAMPRHLVDMTESGLHLLDRSALAHVAHAFRELERGRHGRTAVLVSSMVNAVVPKMFSVISERDAGREETFKITLSRDDALSWLCDTSTEDRR